MVGLAPPTALSTTCENWKKASCILKERVTASSLRPRMISPALLVNRAGTSGTASPAPESRPAKACRASKNWSRSASISSWHPKKACLNCVSFTDARDSGALLRERTFLWRVRKLQCSESSGVMSLSSSASSDACPWKLARSLPSNPSRLLSCRPKASKARRTAPQSLKVAFMALVMSNSKVDSFSLSGTQFLRLLATAWSLKKVARFWTRVKKRSTLSSKLLICSVRNSTCASSRSTSATEASAALFPATSSWSSSLPSDSFASESSLAASSPSPSAFSSPPSSAGSSALSPASSATSLTVSSAPWLTFPLAVPLTLSALSTSTMTASAKAATCMAASSVAESSFTRSARTSSTTSSRSSARLLLLSTLLAPRGEESPSCASPSRPSRSSLPLSSAVREASPLASSAATASSPPAASAFSSSSPLASSASPASSALAAGCRPGRALAECS
mmetsp:Transcript_132151/g.358876  ORF Transcript_132151/g.358876 Transcript_132151/m.358876 type:complete len:451 (+) Transcript_132151:126-1478(+)